MHFLHQKLRDAVESEAACALYQNHFIVQRLEDGAVDERCYIVEEELFLHLYQVGVVHNLRSYAYDFCHTALHCETGHLGVEFVERLACLVNVAQNESASESFVVGTTVHEVESDVE